jgi:hypothetical protein
VTVVGLVDANATDESVQLALQSPGLPDTLVSVTVTEK